MNGGNNMFDVYRISIFIGLYCFILGFGLFESYRRLKTEGILDKGTYTIRNISYSLFGGSAVLFALGMIVYYNL